MLANDIDPVASRKATKEAIEELAINSFEAVAREWLALNALKWAENTHKRTKERMEQCLFPWIGSRPIAEISARELLAALNQTVARGRIDTASRIRADTGRIFRYAIVTGRAERDPTADLIGALPSPRAKHRATLVEPLEVGELLRAIDGYTGTFVTRAVLKLAPLVFLRPGELSKAEWAEFDLDAGEWRIPGERMKMNGRHIVPLAWQAVEILRELHLMTDVTQGAPKLALARIGVGAPKLALARVGVGAPKLALATYPSRLRLDVKASFDAPAIDPCVTSVNDRRGAVCLSGGALP